MHDCAKITSEVRLVCESVSETSTKSLALLRAIEQTIDALQWVQRRADADTEFLQSEAARIKTCERVNSLDADGSLIDCIKEAEGRLGKLYRILIEKQKAARADKVLACEDKEAVVDVYAKAIASVADVHNALVELRWAIGEYDADLEKATGKSHSSVEEMFSAMGV